ncbi:type II toxin-antitoxin system Phd/YefM family antitoxin [Qingshengfaniella alkalisoli]|uniref:Antitoxin n=1 Tax=Qingshengfaniella alkalisoli TaxID=2599296 RepID=A0A5B8JAA4_9RHOB|nr:type II toxin-antitoxin system Phd/YefM family antitoxin [Qingshengfaniella alkalisoli]QDY71130.1 type II toxin-antitoxin system Phd/YefM family antitoxin [Qingshengfaniella alkalisoli]
MWNVQDAKNKFSAVIDAALAGEPQEVSRRGKPTVVVLSVTEYLRLQQAAKLQRGSFVDHLLTFPADAPDIARAKVLPRDVEF